MAEYQMSIWPPLIYLMIWSIGLGMAILQHGTPKTGTNNMWTSLIASIMIVSLLYWGGFFVPLFR